MQDSVLPRGVGLRKPHIPSLLTPFSSLLHLLSPQKKKKALFEDEKQRHKAADSLAVLQSQESGMKIMEC